MGSQLKNKNNNINTYTKDMLIRKIAEDCNKDISTIRKIYNALEESVVELLSSADINTDITIRLFEGISIDSVFIPEKTKVNNLTGKVITTASKIKAKANITRNYCNKLTAHNK